MEKNLAENSDSNGRKDDNQSNAGETPRSPMADPTNAGPKPDGEATETEQPENQNDDATEEKKEEATEETGSPPCTPLPSLEKVSEDIDQLLALPRENDSEKETTPFEIPGYVERFLYLVEEKLGRLDAGEERSKDDMSLIEAVKRISKLIKFLTHQQDPPHSPSSSGEEGNKRKEWLMNRIGLVQQRAMSYLEDDFRSLMEHSGSRTTELDPGGNDHKGKHAAEQQQNQDQEENQPEELSPDFPGYVDETIASLKKIADEMIFGGYQSECCQVYMISRRIALDDALQKLGFEKMSMDEIQKAQFDNLARDMIPAWISTLKQCATVYFPGEKRLSYAVFDSPMELSAGLFSNLTRGVMIQLLNFAEGIAMTKRAGEKLFKLLDMYETLRDAIPKVQELFPEESQTEEMRTEMTLAKGRLGEAAISMFSDFENSVKSEAAKTPVPGGAVHPLTRYIMNYLNVAGDYKETLEQVFKEHSKIERADSTSRPHNDEQVENHNAGENASSPFTARVMTVMELLDSSLEIKARLYRDVALSNFFMMNNGRYILQKIKGSSEIYQLMGDTWCRKRSSELRQYHNTYKRETWNKVLMCLNTEGLNVNGKVQKPVLKERFKSFNALFDEIHRTQSSWVVKDEQLQSELRVSISSVVIPAYRSFLGRFSQYLDPGRQTEKYIKYQVEDIETYIDELFDGKPHQSIARRKT